MWHSLLYSLGLPLVLSQTTTTQCVSNTSTSFLFGPSGESPCLAWSKLQSLCLASTEFVNVPPLLDSTWRYNAPEEATGTQTACECNVVAYNLMAGCTWCQLGREGGWVAEEVWKNGCETYDDTGLVSAPCIAERGIDCCITHRLNFTESVLSIPPFAWKPWNGEFPLNRNGIVRKLKLDGPLSPSSAQASASAASFTAYPTSSKTPTLSRFFSSSPSSSALSNASSGSPTPLSSASPPASSATNTISKHASNVGAIIGGVLGGVIVLVLLVLLIRYRRKTSSSPGREEQTPGRTKSFLNMFGSDDTRNTRTQTHYLADPDLFAHPRAAPKAPTSSYTTTTDRLREKSDADTDSEIYDYNGKEYLHQLPPPPRQDFSRPISLDGQTLPSLYEPHTGAQRYTLDSELGSEAADNMSPRSRYPRESAIGTALGTGTRKSFDWRGETAPELPSGRMR
ncbi:hypothetical protein P7C73_g1358, partial [Tremellales sp. Uapishka_1]